LKEICDEEAEEAVNGEGEGGGLAVWKLSGDAECTLEALEIETLRRDVIIGREKKET
jgi:hypothetical protein